MRIGNESPLPLFLLQPDREVDTPPEDTVDDEGAQDAERAILCDACESPITRVKWCIEVASKHEHVFLNPAGILYRIRCFSAADGIQRHGDYTDEWSWFPATSWCYATCASCRSHLGWHYRGTREFFGLIADRLIEAE